MSRSQRARAWRPPPAPVSGFPRRGAFWVGVVVGLGASAAILVAHFTRHQSPPAGQTLTTVRSFDDRTLPGMLRGPAPWGANTADAPRRAALMGLPPVFGTTVHVHQHLDLFVDGRRVVVPQGIGIDPGGGFLVPLHTHDDSGIIHVESPVERDYTLGEFFGVWGVQLTRRCLGGYCAAGDGSLRVFVDGRRLESDPTQLRLRRHQEIAIVVGKPVAVPSSYDFPPSD
jgi:hypothetical protein